MITGEPAPRLDASPTVVAGRVYIGAESGGFYALNESTGAVVWSRQLDTEPNVTCPARGITATAAVEPDPVDGRVHGLCVRRPLPVCAERRDRRAGVEDRDRPAEPGRPGRVLQLVVADGGGGHIYVGLASGCDSPLIRGGVVELDQHTGQVLHTWYSVPAGSIGGSVWSSVAASPAAATSGCPPATSAIPRSTPARPATRSGTRCRSCTCPRRSNCSRPGRRREPPATATTGTSAPHRPCSAERRPAAEVGACNKNGHYYALAANPLGSSPLWTDVIGAPPRSASARASPARSGTGRPARSTSAATPPPSAAPATADRSARSTRPPVPTSGRPACPAR